MLPKNARLTTTKDIERVIKQKQFSFNSSSFNLYARLNNLPVSRLAISASRKVGNAVKRNSIRRRIKAEFYLKREAFNSGMDIIVFPRKSGKESKSDLLREDMLRAIEYLRSKNDLDHSKFA